MTQTIRRGKVMNVDFNRQWEKEMEGGKNVTIYYFNIVLEENGAEIKGEFSTNKMDQNKFLVGQEIEFVLEVRKGRDNTTYNFINKPEKSQESSPAPTKSYRGKDPKTRRTIISQVCLAEAQRACLSMIIVHGDETTQVKDVINNRDQIKAIAEVFYDWIMKGGSNNEQVEITLQACLKKAVTDIEFSGLKVISSGDIIKGVEYWRDAVWEFVGKYKD
jgi:hypothetical protein